MNPDRTQRISDRVAIWRRSGVQRLVVVPLLTLVFAVVSRLTGVTRDSVLVTIFPIQTAREPRTSATTGRGRAARLLAPTPRRMLASGAALMGGVLIASALAAGSYAYLNSRATTPAIVVQSGNLALTVQYGTAAAGATAALPTAPWATMLPGDVVGQQFTITSTGSAGSTITVRLSATSAWDIRLAPGACPTGQLSGAPLTTAAVVAGSLAGGGGSLVCVQATLPAGAAANVSGTTPAFSILIDSTQVPS